MPSIDPYSLTDSPEDIKPTELSGETSSAYDPYASSDSMNSFNETDQKKMPDLRGEEKILAENYPNVYGAVHAATDLFPYASLLLWKSNQDAFMQLDKEDQIMTLLEEDLAAALWMFGGPLIKDLKYAFRGMVKRPMKATFGAIGRRIGMPVKEGTVLPYEDAMRGVERILGTEKAKPFNYVDVVRKKLQNKGFGKDEAESVASVLAGEDESRLMDVILNRKYEGKDLTKAMQKSIKWQKGRLYPRPELTKGVKTQFGEEKVRGKYYNDQFERVLSKEVYKSNEIQKRTTKHIFNAHATRLFGKNAPQEFGEVTPHHMSNILLDMLENKAVTWQIARPTLMATLKPARVVFGYGQRFLGTLDGAYNPLKGSLGVTNKSYFNNSLLFNKMLEQRGAGKVLVKASGEFKFKKAKWLTPAVQKEAHAILKQMDEITATISKSASKVERDELQGVMTKLINDADPNTKILIETWRAYSDFLYGEHMKLQIPRVFRKAGLNELGQNQIDNMMSGAEGLEYEIDRLFSTISKKTPAEKIVGAKAILKKVKGRLESADKSVHPYFKAEGKDLEKALKKLNADLTWGTRGKGFTKYLENYVARVSQHEDSLLMKWRGGMFKNQSAFYTKIRKLEKMKGEPTDFGTMVQARTMAHAKEHYLYDTLGDVVEYTKGLPPAWIEYIDGYIGGILSVPTVSDYKLAQFMTKTWGSVERLVGKEGLWSEQRVINLSYTINNLTYLGGLGFKPFSAARNLFQPLLTVPADLGGIKDLGKLVQGYKWALNPQNRAYIRSLGAIAEYAPEVHMRPSILRQGKMLFGKEMPTIEGIRDVGMWMFKGSDRFNRYVTGGAANLKWDKAVKKFGHPNTKGSIKHFSRKMNLQGRHPWKQAEVEDLLHRGKFAEAKGTYISDVIADTQYLYGAAEAPTALRKYGAIGRTGFIFQSWWMNYGTMLEKWAMTGDITAKGERALTVFISQAMAYQMMEPIWGKATAIRSTFLGPFPKEFNEFMIPPAWSPVYHAASAIANIQQPEVSSRHAKAILDTSMILIPAGLQIKAFYKGAKNDGWEGFSRAILRTKKD